MAGKYPEGYTPPEGHSFDLEPLDRPAGFFKMGADVWGDV